MSGSGKPTAYETRDRIEKATRYYGGKLPREAAAAWDGYLAALIEWGLLSPDEHASLVALLPKDRYPQATDDPVMQILLGWESPKEAQGIGLAKNA